MTWKQRKQKMEELFDRLLHNFDDDLPLPSTEPDLSATIRERSVALSALTSAIDSTRWLQEINDEADKLYKLRRSLLELVGQLPSTVIGQSNNAVYNIEPLREKIEALQNIDL